MRITAITGTLIRISAAALAQIQEKRGEQLLAGLANLVERQNTQRRRWATSTRQERCPSRNQYHEVIKMRGYPDGPLTKRDYENLLSMPEYAKQAKEEEKSSC